VCVFVCVFSHGDHCARWKLMRQFFITCNSAEYLDGKHVVFGALSNDPDSAQRSSLGPSVYISVNHSQVHRQSHRRHARGPPHRGRFAVLLLVVHSIVFFLFFFSSCSSSFVDCPRSTARSHAQSVPTGPANRPKMPVTISQCGQMY
jgi:cyclophilin family peptidyl-prolyl cis-trans isomerase